MSKLSDNIKLNKSTVTVDQLKALTLSKFLKPRAPSLKTKFLVYAAKHDNEIIYIGSGVNGRERHCTSGCSHVYALNRLHFSKQIVTVEVIARFTTKEDSLEYEEKLITKIKPKFNTIDNPHIASDFQYPLIEKWAEYFMIFGEVKFQLYLKVFRELMLRFTIPELVSENGVTIVGLRKDGIETHRIRKMISCKDNTVEHYDEYKEIYEVFCKIEGRVKIPIEPPEY